jgi:hypothetical protein
MDRSYNVVTFLDKLFRDGFSKIACCAGYDGYSFQNLQIL